MHSLQHRSLHHVLWRGAMALGMLALGIGGTFGVQQSPVQPDAVLTACEEDATLAVRAVVDGRTLAANLAIVRSLRKRG